MRIRTVKPEFWRSEAVTALPRDIRLLWIGLWSYVDDNGVGIDDFRQIAADLFALEDDPMAAREYVREGLATLSRHSRITRYTVAGRNYLHVTNWHEHQRIDRPGKPRYPLPTAAEHVEAAEADSVPAGHDAEQPNSAQDDATPSRHSRDMSSTGAVEQGNRGTGDTPSLRSGDAPRKRNARATRIPDDFTATHITPALVEWARDNAPDVDGRHETEQFVDYWIAQPDRTGRKTDWVATWRKWMRKAQKDITDRRAARPSAAPPAAGRGGKAEAWLALGDEMTAEAAQRPMFGVIDGGQLSIEGRTA